MEITDITKEFLKEKDSLNTVWLSDSWLCMRGIESDKDKRALYDKIAEVKETLRLEGYSFKADSGGLFE